MSAAESLPYTSEDMEWLDISAIAKMVSTIECLANELNFFCIKECKLVFEVRNRILWF